MPIIVADSSRHRVTLSAEHRRRLLEQFPAATITDAIVASSLRGIEASERSRGRACTCDSSDCDHG